MLLDKWQGAVQRTREGIQKWMQVEIFGYFWQTSDPHNNSIHVNTFHLPTTDIESQKSGEYSGELSRAKPGSLLDSFLIIELLFMRYILIYFYHLSIISNSDVISRQTAKMISLSGIALQSPLTMATDLPWQMKGTVSFLILCLKSKFK